MTKKNDRKFWEKEEFGTLSYGYVSLYERDAKMYQVFLNHY